MLSSPWQGSLPASEPHSRAPNPVRSRYLLTAGLARRDPKPVWDRQSNLWHFRVRGILGRRGQGFLERVVDLLLRELVRHRRPPLDGPPGAGPTEARRGSGSRSYRGCSITCLVVALNNARFLGSPRRS